MTQVSRNPGCVMIEFNPERVRENVRKAETFDLLERVTILRAELEPEALTIIMEELLARKVAPEAIVAYEEHRRSVVLDETGNVIRCSYCRSPAVTSGFGWRRLFGVVPIVPMSRYFCRDHAPKKRA